MDDDAIHDHGHAAMPRGSGPRWIVMRMRATNRNAPPARLQRRLSRATRLQGDRRGAGPGSGRLLGRPDLAPGRRIETRWTEHVLRNRRKRTVARPALAPTSLKSKRSEAHATPETVRPIGSPRAADFEASFNRHFDRVYTYLRRRIPREADCQRLVAEVLISTLPSILRTEDGREVARRLKSACDRLIEEEVEAALAEFEWE